MKIAAVRSIVFDAVEIASAVLDQITGAALVSLKIMDYALCPSATRRRQLEDNSKAVHTADRNSVEVAVIAYQNLGWIGAIVTSGETVQGGFLPASTGWRELKDNAAPDPVTTTRHAAARRRPVKVASVVGNER